MKTAVPEKEISAFDRALVKLNCAAIPSCLLESELFGHERGAFTGAITQKSGRLELADHGTLFLDEIGDIPLELQPKLLRVLQEREFERLGSTRTTKVDARLVAATHSDLERMMAEKQFRMRGLHPHTTPCEDSRNHGTLEAAERALILATVKKTRWVLSGPRGAAARLGLKRSTLQFRMKKIRRKEADGSGRFGKLQGPVAPERDCERGRGNCE